MPGRKSGRRSVDGILLLDKSKGMTSNAALQEVKRLYGAKKAGHTGSLDPLATGVLPIFFGEATKFSQFLLNANKHYLAVLRLGVRTDTGDSEGKPLAQAEVPAISESGLEKILSAYRGEISQVPPMYSALKFKGKPLYKLARQGIEVERKARPVCIHQLTLVEQTPEELILDIRCSKGTYIRTLADDIGMDLGCGAHVKALRRLGAGHFSAEATVRVETLKSLVVDQDSTDQDWADIDRHLLPISAAIQGLPRVALTPLAATYIRQGQPVLVANVPTDGLVGLFLATSQGADTAPHEAAFLGIGAVLDDGRIAPRRLVMVH